MFLEVMKLSGAKRRRSCQRNWEISAIIVDAKKEKLFSLALTSSASRLPDRLPHPPNRTVVGDNTVPGPGDH